MYNCVEIVCCVNGGQICNICINYYYFCWWYFFGCSNLFGKEVFKFMCRFNNGVIIGDVCY